MRLVMVSTYPPRRCGLATFTCDLREALGLTAHAWQIGVAAVDSSALAYPDEVMTIIDQHDAPSYRRAADAICAAGTDLVVIQHEYGIFGGSAGRYVLELSRRLGLRGVPYAVTLHTVLASPTPTQYATLQALCADAAAVTVFTPAARRAVVADGVAEEARIAVIPHGGPAVLREPWLAPPVGPVLAETLADVGPARMLSTFGLIAPGKGLEQVIMALPAIVERHPDARYVIAGATHPEVLRRHGESYRQRLRSLAAELGMADHVHFVDAFLTEPELSVLLGRTAIYLTPYHALDQTCSGTLAFALTAGCAVVSTSYQYATQMLAPRGHASAGLLVPPHDPDAIADAVIQLLDDPHRLAQARARAHAIGAHLTWPAVAERFADVFSAAVLSAPVTKASATVRSLRLNGADPPAFTHHRNGALRKRS